MYFFRRAIACYLTALAIVSCGICIGLWDSTPDLKRSPDRVAQSSSRFRDAWSQWDGQWFQMVAMEGYFYEPDRMSSVAFFPLYPLLGRSLSLLTRLPIDVSLLLVSHLCLLLSLALLGRLEASRTAARDKVPQSDAQRHHGYHESCLGYHESCLTSSLGKLNSDQDRDSISMWSLALFPTAFFLQMTYSESLFLLLVLMVFWGFRRGWNVLLLSLVVGLATATRAVGVALWVPLALHIWRSSGDRRSAMRTLVISGPLAGSGLATYMLLQHFWFDTPLAFMQTQDNWRFRPQVAWLEKAIVLLSWEPFWAPFKGSWPTHWFARPGTSSPCIFASLQAANPILFASGCLVAGWGWARRWLDDGEALFAAAMFFIPYVTRAYEMNMASHGRFVLPVFPVFLVLGRLLDGSHTGVRIAYLVTSASYLFVFSWMWAKGYVLI